jgi:hypothetical protein
VRSVGTSATRRGRGARFRGAVAWVALAASLAAPLDARAQVNTENLRKRIKVVGYSLIIEGSLTGDTGNTEGISVGGGLGGGFAKDPHLLFGYARFDYTKYAGVTSVDKTFAHLRYNYEFASWVWGELFAQAQSDAFQRLALRNLFGVGPRFRVIHTAPPAPAAAAGATPEAAKAAAASAAAQSFDVYAGTSYMFERDAIAPQAGAVGPEDRRIQVWHRWNNYVTVQWEMDPRAILATTIYVQPAFNDFGDVRLLSETLLTFKVTKVFTAGIAASVRYDSEPPTGVLTTDTEIKNTLALTF